MGSESSLSLLPVLAPQKRRNNSRLRFTIPAAAPPHVAERLSHDAQYNWTLPCTLSRIFGLLESGRAKHKARGAEGGLEQHHK
jgi:hypothetical protein